MPRIFAPNEDYTSTQNYLNFTNGAAAVAATDTDAIAYFTAELCTIDNSKHKLTVMDTMTRAQINGISAYLGVALDPTDTKAEVIRNIETAVSALKIIDLTVTSAKTAVAKESTITVTTPAPGASHIYKYKAAVEAPVLLYGDDPSSWTTFTSGAVITPLTDGDHIAVVECNAAGDFVLGYGTIEIDAEIDATP